MEIGVRTDITNRIISFTNLPYIPTMDYCDDIAFAYIHELGDYRIDVGSELFKRDGTEASWNDPDIYEIRWHFSADSDFDRYVRKNFIRIMLASFDREIAEHQERMKTNKSLGPVVFRKAVNGRGKN